MDLVITWLHVHRFFVYVGLVAALIFACWRTGFWLMHRHSKYFFFDPQDCFANKPQGRVLPRSAETATFEPFLKHYLGLTQITITISAASIAFGGNGQQVGLSVKLAKFLLGWSTAYGVLFCALLLWRYDEYSQDMHSFTPRWYANIFGLGFDSLTCFILWYLAWGFGAL